MRTLPSPRGPISERLLAALSQPPPGAVIARAEAVGDALAADDLHLALYLCYELHYRGLPGIDERWEWDPELLRLRSELEREFEQALLAAVPLAAASAAPGEMDLALRALAEDEGPSLSNYIRTEADLGQVYEFLVHRSAYQLKEADPHSWAIPRLSGAAKGALVEIQADEYGQGRVEWIHAEMFARALGAMGLDPSYGAYLELIPGVTLATVNLMSLFGLHRRLRGAIVGHLALFEMTSSIPNGRYASGLRRLGFDGDATLFFDEHVTADAVHENIAAVDLAGGLARQDPTTAPMILWGAHALAELDRRWATHVLESWRAGRTSLRAPLSSLAGPVAEQSLLA